MCTLCEVCTFASIIRQLKRASARRRFPRHALPYKGSELLIPCGDLSSPWNQHGPKRSDGVAEYWCFQHSNTPLLHHSETLNFHRVGMSEVPLTHRQTAPFQFPQNGPLGKRQSRLKGGVSFGGGGAFGA